ncbi:hypothetical protein GEMRC1_009418 [Eukaryota sp. GEM-RC1]
MAVDWVAQLSGFAIILVLGFAGGMLPAKVSKSQKSSKTLSFMNAFTGGLFFAVGLESFTDAAEDFGELNFLESIGLGSVPWHMSFALLAVIIIMAAEFGFVDVHGDDLLIQYENDTSDPSHSHGTSPYLLVVLLSIHSLLEGAAVGSASGRSFYVILIAICAHKFFAALALGTSITRGGIPFGKHFILVAIFALSTPLGQFIGISFSSFLKARAAAVSSAIFASLATGTFAWVALCEILHPEMEMGTISDKRKKVLLAFLGMLSIIIVTAIMEEHD